MKKLILGAAIVALTGCGGLPSFKDDRTLDDVSASCERTADYTWTLHVVDQDFNYETIEFGGNPHKASNGKDCNFSADQINESPRTMVCGCSVEANVTGTLMLAGLGMPKKTVLYCAKVNKKGIFEVEEVEEFYLHAYRNCSFKRNLILGLPQPN